MRLKTILSCLALVMLFTTVSFASDGTTTKDAHKNTIQIDDAGGINLFEISYENFSMQKFDFELENLVDATVGTASSSTLFIINNVFDSTIFLYEDDWPLIENLSITPDVNKSNSNQKNLYLLRE